MSNLPAIRPVPGANATWLRIGPALVLLVTALTYLSSLGGGFLNWDDPWLLENNAMLKQPTLRSLGQSWTDLSLPTRWSLGAEYLPIRDTSHWIEARLTGIVPLALRLNNLGIYLAALAVLQRTLRRVFGTPSAALVATAFFAWHSVHVESVAWLAGRKDVLALLFGALAMHSYVSRCGNFAFKTAAWCLLATLSKSMSLVVPFLLPLFDLWMQRRPNQRALLWGSVAAMAPLPLQLYVGHLVGMTQPLPGASLSLALATMGPVWWRYLEVLLWPPSCSLVHDVPTANQWTLSAIGGYAVVALPWLIGIWLWLKKQVPQLFAAWAFIWLPLVPVSQVVAPLQNRMADRYLWWTVLGAGMLLAWLVERLPKIGSFIALSFLFFLVATTARRAALFGDSALIFADATRKTQLSGIAPYQLAMALEEQGAIGAAKNAYEEVWRRTGGMHDSARRATNNLARLEVRLGRLDDAEAVLLRGLEHFPNDPTMRRNLEKVHAKQELARER